MPKSIDYSGHSDKVANFNSRFKVNFDFNAMDMKIQKFRNVSHAFNVKSNDPNFTIEDMIYRTTYLNTYKDALRSLQDNKTETLDNLDFYNEFERLMQTYRDVRKANGEKFPRLNGGWKDHKTILGEMQKIANQIKSDRYADTREAYDNRGVRLRDMRAKLDFVRNNNDHTATDLAQLILYETILQRKLSKPIPRWNLIALLRARSERRDQQALRNYLNTRTNSQRYAQAFAIANAQPLEQVKQQLSDNILGRENAENNLYNNPNRNNNVANNTNIKEKLPLNSNLKLKNNTDTSNKKEDNKKDKDNKKETSTNRNNPQPIPPMPQTSPMKTHIPVILPPEPTVIVKPTSKYGSQIMASINNEFFKQDTFDRLNQTITNILDREIEAKEMLDAEMDNDMENAIPEIDKDAIMKRALPPKVRESIYKDLYVPMVRTLKTMANDYDTSINLNRNSTPLSVQWGARTIFSDVFKTVARCQLPLRESLLISQKFTDDMLRRHSPVRFDRPNLEKYANNFVLKDDDKFLRDLFMKTTKETTVSWYLSNENTKFSDKQDELNSMFDKELEQTKQLMGTMEEIRMGQATTGELNEMDDYVPYFNEDDYKVYGNNF